jgi:hypothetical protein
MHLDDETIEALGYASLHAPIHAFAQQLTVRGARVGFGLSSAYTAEERRERARERERRRTRGPRKRPLGPEQREREAARQRAKRARRDPEVVRAMNLRHQRARRERLRAQGLTVDGNVRKAA